MRSWSKWGVVLFLLSTAACGDAIVGEWKAKQPAGPLNCAGVYASFTIEDDLTGTAKSYDCKGGDYYDTIKYDTEATDRGDDVWEIAFKDPVPSDWSPHEMDCTLKDDDTELECGENGAVFERRD